MRYVPRDSLYAKRRMASSGMMMESQPRRVGGKRRQHRCRDFMGVNFQKRVTQLHWGPPRYPWSARSPSPVHITSALRLPLQVALWQTPFWTSLTHWCPATLGLPPTLLSQTYHPRRWTYSSVIHLLDSESLVILAQTMAETADINTKSWSQYL